MSTQGFVIQIVPYVRFMAEKYGIKVISPILGQAVLESASGTSELAINAHNYFGLKYNPKQPDRCPSANGYYIKGGSEQKADGSYVSSTMSWQRFSNLKTGIMGYGEFLFSKYAGNRYNNLKGVTDPKTYLERIKIDGYATSLNYVDKVMNVINFYNLTQYDVTEEQTKKFYRVQCGAFQNRDNAEKLKQKLSAAGFPAIVVQDNNLYRTQVGAYSVKNNAKNMQIMIKNKGFDAITVYS